jgi:hypothetical protein
MSLGKLSSMLGRKSSRHSLLKTELMYSGQYDQEYLDYLRALLESMGKAGLVAYVVSCLCFVCDTKAQTTVNPPRRLVPILWRCKLLHAVCFGQADPVVRCTRLDPRGRRLRSL